MCFLRHQEKDPSIDNILTLASEVIQELNEPTIYHYS